MPVDDKQIIIRLFLAFMVGALIGAERKIMHKPAGMRTHALVGLGAALFTIVYTGMALFIALLLRDQLGIGAGLILLLTSFGNILAIPATTRWRRVADRHGSPVVMAANGVIVLACLTLLGFVGAGWAPLPLLVVICALIPITESGNYVAVSRGYMLRMKPRVRHACNAVWSAGTQLLAGCSAIFMGYWLKAGETSHYRSAAWGYAALMAVAIWIALHLPVPHLDAPRDASPVYDPAHPFRSLGRVIRYVLRPARSRIIMEEDPRP